MGKRLGQLTRDNTKCMLEVNGIRLIDRTLEHLHAVGVDRIVLVVGYKGEKVRSHVGTDYKGIPVEYVENDIYDKTNNIYSLFLARNYLLEEDTLLLESDIIFNLDVLQAIVNAPYPNLALVDKYESWMDGTVVTLGENCRIKSFLDKEEFRYEDIKSYYKTVNIYKFSKEFSSRYYVPFLEAYSTSLGKNAYYEQVLKVILLLHDAPIRALPLSGQTWYEIDDAQDLDIATGMFAPDGESHYASISKRYGGYWRYPQMLDFCYLVNPYFPTQRLKDELRANFDTLLTEYPSGMKVNTLIASKCFGVSEDYLIPGNGAAELIKLLMESSQGKTGFIRPTFEEYPNRYDKEQQVTFVPHNDEYRYTADDLMAFFNDKDICQLMLINPDNPSGNFIPKADVLRLAQWSKELGIRLVVDESFVDFSTDYATNSLLSDQILETYPNLVVMKSISKSYGVPGLRLGILASADKELIARMKKEVSIWNLNSFAEFFMQIYNKHEKDYQKACARFVEERDSFERHLREIPFIRVFPTQANYFLCEVLPPYTANEIVVRMLKQHNILTRDCSGKTGLNPNKQYMRIAIRNHEDNMRLTEALKKLI